MNVIFRHSIYYIILLIVITLPSCESLKKDFDPGVEVTTPKLVVHANLDNADSIFTASIGVTIPVVTTNNGQNVPSLTEANIKLYEDNNLILDINQSVQGGVYSDIYFRKKIPTKLNNIYQIEVSAPSFETVTSAISIPQVPQLNICYIDTAIIFNKKDVIIINEYGDIIENNYYYHQFHPTKIEIVDFSGRKNYYLIEPVIQDTGNFFGLTGIGVPYLGTSDRLLVQENPHIESYDVVNSNTLGTYLFYQMVISDLAFANGICTNEFLITHLDLNSYSKNSWLRSGYTEHELKEYSFSINIRVKHLSSDAYKYYRSIAFQNQDMGIPAFTEPISIYSNINKGYGCFSMTSSTQKEALRYKVYLPKDYGIYYSIP